jgi:hypothetical protein
MQQVSNINKEGKSTDPDDRNLESGPIPETESPS